jgi:putative transposase
MINVVGDFMEASLLFFCSIYRRRSEGCSGSKSLRHAARFCSAFSTVCNRFRPGRHALSAPNYRTVMRRRWREWDVVSETTAFAVAA